MKYVVFFFTLFCAVPAGFILAKQRPIIEKIIMGLSVAMTCSLMGSINFVSHETYRGTSRGFEITLIDLLALILLFLVISRKDTYKIKMFPPGTILYFGYFTLSCLSAFNSGVVLYSLFEMLKLFRMYLYFWIFYNYLRSYEQVEVLYKFILGVCIYIFIIVIKQKYLQGVYQCPGPFPHQNSLVMYMNIFASIIFARIMNKKMSFIGLCFNFMVFGMCAICIISTLSRGGLFCFSISIFLIFIYSYAGGFSLKKLSVTLLFTLAAVVILAASIGTILQRFDNAPTNSKKTRVELAEAAVRMAHSHFLGVGLNNFGLKINPPYPYGKFIKRTAWNKKEGLVETTYLMIAAETGWLNLIMYLLFLWRFYIMNIVNYFVYKKSNLAYVCIGLAGGLSAIYLESTLEWVLRQTNNSYQLMFVFALIGLLTKFRKGQFLYNFPEWKKRNNYA